MNRRKTTDRARRKRTGKNRRTAGKRRLNSRTNSPLTQRIRKHSRRKNTEPAAVEPSDETPEETNEASAG
jgi:hypothetical protein